MKIRYTSHFVVILLVIFSVVPTLIPANPVQRAVAAPVATATPMVRLLPIYPQVNGTESRGTVSGREARTPQVAPATPLATPFPLNPNATPLPPPPPIVIATAAPVAQRATPAPVIVPEPTQPVQANIVGTVFPVPGGGISQYYSAGHPAIDIHAPCGTPVIATFGGSVTQSGWKENGGGIVVTVATDLGVMEYNHLSGAVAVTGQFVATGQIIGYVGATGWATGCHLHFAVLRDGIWIDPFAVL